MSRCLISNDFETSRHEATLKYLGRWFDNASLGMTAEKYYTMCDAMGDEPDPNKVPPEYEDFPSYVHLGIDIFNALPDNYSGGMSSIYCGKDLASLPVLFDLYQVSDHIKIKTFEVIRFLDSRARKQAVKEAEKANKKASRK